MFPRILVVASLAAAICGICATASGEDELAGVKKKLASQSANARCEAVMLLPNLDKEKAIPVLQEFASRETDADVLWQVTVAASRIGDARLIPTMEKIINREVSKCEALTGSFGPGTPKRTDKDKELLARISAMRVSAVDAIAAIRTGEATASLVGLLGNSLSEVRARAACRLGEIGGADAMDALLKCAPSETNPDVLTEMARVFGKIRDPRALPLLAAMPSRACEGSLVAGDLVKAAAALRITSTETAQALLTLFKEVETAILAIGGEEAEAALASMKETKEKARRNICGVGLGNLISADAHDTKAVDPPTRGLKNNGWQVGFNAGRQSAGDGHEVKVPDR